MFEKFDHFEKQPEAPASKAEDIHANFVPSDSPNIEKGEQVSQATEKINKGEWVDTGIHDVPISKIDVSDSPVKGSEDFKKVSHSEMVKGFHTLESEVHPAVEKGSVTDHFRSMDERKGLDYSRGTQKVYESFYGQESIRLEKIGDSYKVINGYHRLYVANELKLSTVPARVLEQRL
jgi:hypothetical protein